jgi:hypothetical protein
MMLFTLLFWLILGGTNTTSGTEQSVSDSMRTYLLYSVESLYSGHPWGSLKCPHFSDILLYVVGTKNSVLIKGGGFISGVSL